MPPVPFRDTPATGHAARRAAERYGIDASAWDWRQLLIDITDTLLGVRASAVLLRRHTNGNERWLVRLGAVSVIAVWQPFDAAVLTVLPADARQWQQRVSPRAPGRTRRERVRVEVWE